MRQPRQGWEVLFAGSHTEPDGAWLKWFFDNSSPQVTGPQVRLILAG